MTRFIRRDWWAEDTDVAMCELCGCPIQRTPAGTLADGLRLHVRTVHEGKRPASLTERRVGAS